MFFKLFIIYCVLIQFIACEFSYNDLPVDSGDAPLVVETLITLEKVSSFNLKELDFSIIYFQEQYWKIKRKKCDEVYLNKLKDYLNVNVTAGQKSNRQYIINLSHMTKLSIWVPNSFQIDSKRITRIPPSNELVELELQEDFCYFNLKTRLNVKVGCQMYFKNYPNDIQICPFRLTSYTYPLDSVVYKWREPGVITNQLVKQINQYTLSLTKFEYNSTKYDAKVNFSYLEIRFRFENHLSHYLLQVVLPSYFIISIVNLNFYMRADGSPGRFLLTILTFICLVTIYTSSRDKLPALSYANAVDIFILGNLFFVFIAISELVMHSFIVKRTNKKEQEAKAKAREHRKPSSEIYIITPSEDNHSTNGKLRNDNMSNFMYNNTEFQKSTDNLHSEVITVGSSNNLLTLSGKDVPIHSSLHSTVHSSIENVLNNRINRYSTQMNETKVEFKKSSYNLDRIFRIWFPVCYIIYNLIYWIILLNRWFDVSLFGDDEEFKQANLLKN